MKRVGIIGAGRWGTTLALILEEKGFYPILWDKERGYLSRLSAERKTPLGIPLPPSIRCCHSLEQILHEANILFFTTPSSQLREVAESVSNGARGKLVVCGTKGLEDSGKRMSQVIEECTGNAAVVISGPAHAEELSLKLPSALVAASFCIEDAEMVQSMLSTPYLRIYTSTDVVGVELCAALKNVIAIAAGICDGLKLGDNAKAALITRGLAEIRRLGERMGAYPFTFMGLAGVGDLITTCTSPHSRNRAFGELLSKGFSPFDAERSISQTVEGIKTALAAKRLADHFCVELPICQKVYEVIYCGGKVEEAVSALMQRPWKKEEAQIMMQGGGLNDKS